MRWDTAPILYGLGATREIGDELQALGVRRVAIITDANIVATGLVDEVEAYASQAGLETVVWSGGQMEPTDASVLRAVADLSDEQLDGYVGLGGGSCIDTCKAVNLLRRYPADPVSYVARPHGEGRKVPGPLLPMIGVPTTSGSGAESTSAANLEFAALGDKATIIDPALRPALAIIDPLNTRAAPAAVTASSGYDVVIQALESYTSRPFDQMPAAPKRERSAMVGANPISDGWCERTLELCGRFLARAVAQGDDLDARVGMTLAAMFSRLGNAGAHIPHANAIAVSSLARGYTPPGFAQVDRPVVPHGYAVAATSPEAFAFTYAGAPERHLRAAELLGVSADEVRDNGERALSHCLRDLIKSTDGPSSLGVFGLTRDDVPGLAERAAAQKRLLPRSPQPVTADDLAGIFARSL